jgi:hypothetical protein
MPKQNFPTWLTDVNFAKDGVGDLKDLRHEVRIGEKGRWVGVINPGWFYYSDLEQYEYNVKGQVTISNASSAVSGTATQANSYNPGWGPVQVFGTGDVHYTPLNSAFYPARQMSWTEVGTGIWRAQYGVSQTLAGVRNLTTTSLASVASSSRLFSDEFFYHDEPNRNVFVKAASDPTTSVFLDIIATEPHIYFREVLVSDGGLVTPSYYEVADVTFTRSTQSATVSGVSSSGIAHGLTVSDGDWVLAEYYVPNSFCISRYKTIQYYVHPSSGDTLTVDYETSTPDILPPARIETSAAPVSAVLNYNPLLPNAYKTGYLFHSDTASTYQQLFQPAEINLVADKTTYTQEWGEVVGVHLIVVDENDAPVPFAPLTLTLGSDEVVESRFPEENRVDARGEAHYRISKPTAGDMTISVTVSSLGATATVTDITPASLLTEEKYSDGFVHLVVENVLDPYNRYKTYLAATYADGIPRTDTSITVRCLQASVLDNGERVVPQELTDLSTSRTTKNLGCLYFATTSPNDPKPQDYIGYGPYPKDKVHAYIKNSTAGFGPIVRTDDA